MVSPQAAEFPFNSEEEYELVLGESFLSNHPTTGFHTVRYDFKPASVDTSQPGNLEVGEGGEVTVSLPNTQDSGTTVYRGPNKPCPKECILVVDKRKRTITLERLASTVQLKKIRSAPTIGNNTKGSQPQQLQGLQTETENTAVNTTDDAKAQAIPDSNRMSDSSESDSSSGTDSDLEDVEDEEVAKLNASLIGNAEATDLVETPSSYNQICKDLELSESGSDSD